MLDTGIIYTSFMPIKLKKTNENCLSNEGHRISG